MEFSRNNSEKPKRIEWKDRWLIFNDFSHTLIFVIRKQNCSSDPTEQMSIDHEWSLRSPQDISSDRGKNADPTKSPINLWPPLGLWITNTQTKNWFNPYFAWSIPPIIIKYPLKNRNSYWIHSFWKGNLCHVGGFFSAPMPRCATEASTWARRCSSGTPSRHTHLDRFWPNCWMAPISTSFNQSALRLLT